MNIWFYPQASIRIAFITAKQFSTKHIWNQCFFRPVLVILGMSVSPRKQKTTPFGKIRSVEGTICFKMNESEGFASKEGFERKQIKHSKMTSWRTCIVGTLFKWLLYGCVSEQLHLPGQFEMMLPPQWPIRRVLCK